MNQYTTNDRNCTDIQALLEEYVAGELDSETESIITSHLPTCDSCQQELQLVQTIDTVLDDLPKPTTPPEVLSEVTAYVQAHPKSGWIHRVFQLTTFLDFLRSPLLRVSASVCLVGIVVFGVYQYQQNVKVEQATRDFNYAISKMNFAVQKTGLAVNDSFTSLKVDEAPRRALKPTANVSSAIQRSLGIINNLTGSDMQHTSDTIPSKTDE